VVTEGGAHVVVNLEPVRHVNVEAFFLELEERSIRSRVKCQPLPQPPALPNLMVCKMSERAPLGTGKSRGPRSSGRRQRKTKENGAGEPT
jgi:hypothetical protein